MNKKSVERMESNTTSWPYFKRFMEWYRTDPEFRIAFEENPEKALKDKKLLLDAETAMQAAVQLFSPGKKEQEGNRYLTEYSQRILQVHEELKRKTKKEQFRTRTQFLWNKSVQNRLFMENSELRYYMNMFYVPIAFELGVGCTVQCPFCGVSAEKWKKNFAYTQENARLWREVLKETKKIIGEIVKMAPCYYATEPLDHPDYEKFIADFAEITGEFPQTTTALADRDPQRLRRLFTMIGEEKMAQAAVRFSIRTKNQFCRITEMYSAEELKDVEILSNNIESMYAYSNSGRVRKNQKLFPEKKVHNHYSISCIAGVRVNMESKTIVVQEPEIPTDDYPEGIQIHEICTFMNARDYAEKLKAMIEKWELLNLPENRILYINPYTTLKYETQYIVFEGDKISCKMGGNHYFFECIKEIENAERTFQEIAEKIAIDELFIKDIKEKLDFLFQKGYIRYH